MGSLCKGDGLDCTKSHNTKQKATHKWDSCVSETLDSARRVSHWSVSHVSSPHCTSAEACQPWALNLNSTFPMPSCLEVLHSAMSHDGVWLLLWRVTKNLWISFWVDFSSNARQMHGKCTGEVAGGYKMQLKNSHLTGLYHPSKLW